MNIGYNQIQKFKDNIAREIQAITYDNRVLKDNGDFNEYQMNCNRLSGIQFVMNLFEEMLSKQERVEKIKENKNGK